MDKGEDKVSVSDAVMMGCPFDFVSHMTKWMSVLDQEKLWSENQYGRPGILVSSNLCIGHRFYNLSDAKNLSYCMIYVYQRL